MRTYFSPAILDYTNRVLFRFALDLMAVKSETEEIILSLLDSSNGMSVNDIFLELSAKNGYSERIVKEAILKLREEGKIRPNRQWKMESTNV